MIVVTKIDQIETMLKVKRRTMRTCDKTVIIDLEIKLSRHLVMLFGRSKTNILIILTYR